MKSGAPFFRADIIYMIYLDVNNFSAVFLSIYYENLAVKAFLTTMGHFLPKNLNIFLFEIILNSIALNCQCLKHTLKFLIRVLCIPNKS